MSVIIFLFVNTYNLPFTMGISAQPQISRGGVRARSSKARTHRHCPEPLSLALLGHGSSNYQEGEKAGLLTVPSRNENIVVGLNFSVWM